MKRISTLLALVAATAVFADAATYHRFTATLHYGGTTQENVPTLVRLSPALVPGFSFADTDGTDFEIEDDAGHVLPYEIDSWNSASGELLLWVKVPVFATNKVLTVTYGRTNENMSARAPDVWSGYAGVWHMNGTDAADSTANGFHGTASGAVSLAASGRLGGAVSIDGETLWSGISCGEVLPNPQLLTNGCTVSAWVKPSSYNPSDHPRGQDGFAFFGKRGCLSVRFGSEVQFVATTPSGADHKISNLTLPGPGTWFHVATTLITNTTAGCKLYLDGTLAGSKKGENKPPTNPTETTELFLGRNQWEQQGWRGDLDEIRLMTRVATPDYLAAEYAAMAQADLLTYGPLETLGRPVVPGDTYHRFTATVDYDGEPVGNVPVLLRLSTAIDGFDYADFIAEGRDLEIRDGNGETLPFEIDTWDTNGVSLVWVKMPLFADGETLEATYGRSTSDGTANASAVWDRYVGVWHFNRLVPFCGPYGGFLNSTAVGGLDGEMAKMSIAGEDGAVGAGVRIAKNEPAYRVAVDGKDRVRYGGVHVPDSGPNGPLDLGDTFTISGWFRHTADRYEYDKLFFKRGSASNDGDLTGSFGIQISTESTTCSVRPYGSGNDSSTSAYLTDFLNDRWGHLSFSYDGPSCVVATNGAACWHKKSQMGYPVTPVTDNDSPLCFGHNPAGRGNGVGGNAWVGWMDEVRLMDGTPTAAYAAAEYAAMARDVVSFGAVEEAAVDAAMPAVDGVPSFGWNDAAGAFVLSATVSTGATGRVIAVYTDLDTGASTTNVLLALDGTETFPLVATDAPALPANRMFRYAVVAENADGTQSVRTSGLAPVHTGALTVECLQDADEAWLAVPASNGVFRISRATGAGASVANDLTVAFALSGSAVDSLTLRLPPSFTATIPAGEPFVDISFTPVYNPTVTVDTVLVLAIAGTNVADPSSSTGSMLVRNFNANPLERWISPAGSDEANGTSPATPMRTPGAALAAIRGSNPSDGDVCTIHALPGEYPVAATLQADIPVRILGEGATPSDVVFSNTVTSTATSAYHARVIKIDHPDALLAGVTLCGGESFLWSADEFGTAFFIHSRGGTVSNCVVERCTARGYAAGAGWIYGPGLVTHSVFRDLTPGWAPAEPGQCNLPIALLAHQTGRIENCLFTDLATDQPFSVVRLHESATMRNCTFAKITLGPTGGPVFKPNRDDPSLIDTNTPCASPVFFHSGSGRAVNTVMVDVRDTNGTAVGPVFTRSNGAVAQLDHCVMDAWPSCLPSGVATPSAAIAESCSVVAPAAVPSLFRGWRHDEFTPEKDGALCNAGANYEGMPAVDLAGHRRVRGAAIDIGAFECFPPEATIMVLR